MATPNGVSRWFVYWVHDIRSVIMIACTGMNTKPTEL